MDVMIHCCILCFFPNGEVGWHQGIQKICKSNKRLDRNDVATITSLSTAEEVISREQQGKL